MSKVWNSSFFIDPKKSRWQRVIRTRRAKAIFWLIWSLSFCNFCVAKLQKDLLIVIRQTMINNDTQFFIARQHTAADARYWYSNSVRLSVRLSVCLSVRDTLVLYENGLTYRHSFFHHTVAQSFQFYGHQTSTRNSDGVTPCGGAKYRWGIKSSDFLYQ